MKDGRVASSKTQDKTFGVLNHKLRKCKQILHVYIGLGKLYTTPTKLQQELVNAFLKCKTH